MKSRTPAALRPFLASPLRTASLLVSAAAAVALFELGRTVLAGGAGSSAGLGWGLRPESVPADGGVFGRTAFARSVDSLQAEGLEALLTLFAGVFCAAVLATCTNALAGWAQHGLARRSASATRRSLGEPRWVRLRRSVGPLVLITGTGALLGGGPGWAVSVGLLATLPESLARVGATPSAPAAALTGALLALGAALLGLLSTSLGRRRLPALLSIGARVTEDPAVGFFRRSMASVQIAALVTVVGTVFVLGWAVLSPQRDAWTGFEVGDTAVARVELGGVGEEALALLHVGIRESLSTATGASAVSISSPGTLTGQGARDYVTTYCGACPAGGMVVDIISVDARRAAVSAGFFEAHGQAALEGRSFGTEDAPDAPGVVLVSESYARRFVDGVAIGKRVMASAREPAWSTIVGVVPDLPEGGFAAAGDPVPSIYLPAAQALPSRFDVALQGVEEPAEVDAVLAEALAAGLPASARVRVSEARPLVALLAETAAAPRWLALLLAAAALPALILSLIGMVTTMREDVRARSWEFGIRAALGASPRSLARSIVLRGAGVGARGLVAGLLMLMAVNQTLADRLPALGGVGAGLMGSLALAVMVISVGASIGPARRVSRSDPGLALARRDA
ncbi:MAG: ABC transporter permease [Gemmatimonadota bacterium]